MKCKLYSYKSIQKIISKSVLIGSSSQIYKYKDPETKQEFVIKIISPQQTSSFQNEIDILSILNYPTILKLYGFSLTPPSVITPYMPDTLPNVMDEAPSAYNLTKKYVILLGVALGMKY